MSYNNDNKKFSFKVFLVIVAILLVLGFCIYKTISNVVFRLNQSISSDASTILTYEAQIADDKLANIVAIGDTLCHSQNFKDAYDSSTGVYDFSPMFKYVTKYFTDATVAVGNLEATLAGPSRGYSGYPTFNTPEHLAIDLKELGLDVMTTANNHT